MPEIFAKFQSTITITTVYHTLVDIVGPLTTTQGNYKYIVVAVEYFTKWIEVKPLVNRVATGFKRFFWQNIICHFGVPRKIIVDNDKQFDCHIFKDFCHRMGVEATFASFYHPQSNGTVEKTNALIFLAIKKILEDQSKGKWAEVVWSHNTSICRATKFTPFKLLYDEEPVTPKEIKLRSARTKAEAIYNPTEVVFKDLLEPELMKVIENLQSYQNETRAWRDKKVKQKDIENGDLVLL
jgi:hypothetical protein